MSRFPLALALASALILTQDVHAANEAPIPKDAAAVVNGVAISRAALNDVVESVVAQLDTPPSPEATTAYRKQALESLIDFELLYQDGQARGFTVTPAEVAAEIAKTQKAFRSPEEYEKALAAKKLTREDIERETRRALVVNRVLNEVVWPRVTVREEDIQAYYAKNAKQFAHPEEIRASYILIRSKGPSSRSGTRDKANSIAKRAHDGEDFGALARETSEDPASAPNGGDLGYVSRGTMGKNFDDSAFSLADGQVSNAIEAPAGFMVIKVTTRRPPGVTPLAEVRDRIVETLRTQGRQQAEEDYVAALRVKAKVDVSPDLR